MSGDAEQEYFADGISEDIITALSKLPQLFVIARNSSFTFKGKNVNIGEVGKSLGVRNVLEGSVRKAGGRVRITAQLIDATTGGHLWAERFDRDLTDIFAVQDDVTSQIVSALALNLSRGDRQSIAAEHTDNQEAYDCFLRGRELWWRIRESQPRGRAPAPARNRARPRICPGLAFLAATMANAYSNGWSEKPGEALEEAENAARQAVKLDERYPYALWSLAMTLSWDAPQRGSSERRREGDRVQSEFRRRAQHGRRAAALCRPVGGGPQILRPRDGARSLISTASSSISAPRRPTSWANMPRPSSLLRRRILRNPETDTSRVLLAASWGRWVSSTRPARHGENCCASIPAYSLEQRRNVLPYKNPADFERIVEGLRKAGLPET